jgi:hypothetical protein
MLEKSRRFALSVSYASNSDMDGEESEFAPEENKPARRENMDLSK